MLNNQNTKVNERPSAQSFLTKHQRSELKKLTDRLKASITNDFRQSNSKTSHLPLIQITDYGSNVTNLVGSPLSYLAIFNASQRESSDPVLKINDNSQQIRLDNNNQSTFTVDLNTARSLADAMIEIVLNSSFNPNYYR